MVLDHQDGTSEISAEELFSTFERQPVPVIDGKIEQLPLRDPGLIDVGRGGGQACRPSGGGRLMPTCELCSVMNAR